MAEAPNSISCVGRRRSVRLRKLLLAAVLLSALPATLAQDARDVQTDVRRDAWQRPAEILDALGVGEGMSVADIGCGRGYFTAHLARRVGRGGVVYAVDTDAEALAEVERLVERNGFGQVRIVRGERDDPRLPADTLDGALIVDTYHEFTQPDAMLEKIFTALKPGGRLGIIDRVAEPGEERSSYLRRHRIPQELIQDDAARHGFRFARAPAGFVRPRDNLAMYFLIFEKPGRPAGPD